MKFSDNIKRDELDIVFVIRTKAEMKEIEESNSLLGELERDNFLKKGNNIYSVPVRDVKIGESVYDKIGKFVTYRSN